LHDALTEYLIDLGVDTSEANADALEMMGLD
jgi:hypothetical protein